MNLKLAKIFGIPIVKAESVYNLSEDEINYINNIKTFKRDDSTRISKQKNILNSLELKNLKNKINECASFFIDNIICVDNKFEIVSSWIAKSINKHEKHNHKNAIFSVIYYAKANQSTLKIIKERNFITEGFNFDLNYKKLNDFNSTTMSYNVKTGDLIMFPGHLLHEGINHSNKEKIVIGANYFIRGEVGIKQNITSLKI